MQNDSTSRIGDEMKRVEAVRWRFRICNYLFRTSFVWIVVGVAGMMAAPSENQTFFFTIGVVGFGIFTTAFALTLAIYRCPACDHFISRFRRRKDQCGFCQTRIW